MPYLKPGDFRWWLLLADGEESTSEAVKAELEKKTNELKELESKIHEMTADLETSKTSLAAAQTVCLYVI